MIKPNSVVTSKFRHFIEDLHVAHRMNTLDKTMLDSTLIDAKGIIPWDIKIFTGIFTLLVSRTAHLVGDPTS